ncbi:MAG: hypothetical protein AAFP26_14365, partial [Planctomycetota bacterium]
MWERLNDSLRIGDFVNVHVTRANRCFGKSVRYQRDYFLLLTPTAHHLNATNRDEAHYRQLEPPLPAAAHKHRRFLFRELSSSASSEQQLRVLLPERKLIMSSQIKLVPCRVQTALPADRFTVEWLRADGRPATGARLSVERDEVGNVGLVVMRGQVGDGGSYTCRVRAGSRTHQASTFIDVFDPFYEPCDASRHCSGNGECHRHRLNHADLFCRCRSGYAGAACNELAREPEGASNSDGAGAASEGTVRNLTIVVALLGVAIVASTLALLFNVARLRKTIARLPGRHAAPARHQRLNGAKAAPTSGARGHPYTVVAMGSH